MCVCYVYKRVYVCVNQKKPLGVLLCCSLPWCPETGPLTEPRALWLLNRLAGQPAPATFLPLTLTVLGSLVSGFYMDAGMHTHVLMPAHQAVKDSSKNL